MKNTKLASALAIAMGLAAVGTASAQSSNGGTITFLGTLTDSTCTVKGGAGTDEGTGNFTVTLDDTPASALSAANSTAAPKTFNVEIGGEGETTCGATSSGGSVVATMTFGITPATDTNGNLNNILVNEATNVQIQLLNNDSSVINLSQANAGLQSATIINNSAQMQYTAQYFSAEGGATPGKISTNTVYLIAYN
jgi:major type 1 subunit fimbrin (pilin)